MDKHYPDTKSAMRTLFKEIQLLRSISHVSDLLARELFLLATKHVVTKGASIYDK